MRWLLYATGALFFLTGVQLFVLSGETATYFAWSLVPPIAAAALGAAYLAAATAQVLAARQSTWARARVAVPWLGAFSILVLAVTLIRFGEFHFSTSDAAPQFAAWLWLATCAGTTAATALLAWVQMRTPGGDPPRDLHLPRSLRTSFLVETALLLVLGVPFLLVPGPASKIVPYALSPLTAQVIGAGFLGFALFTYSARRENDVVRVKPAGGLLTVFSVLELVTLIRYAGDVGWLSPVTWVYVLFMASFLPTGLRAWFGPNGLRFRSSTKETQGAVLPGLQPGPTTKSGVAQADGFEDRPWFRHWPPDVPRSLAYPDATVPNLLHQTAERIPDRVAVRFFKARLTYRGLDAAADRFASGLRNLGVRPGDRVSLILPNTPHLLIALLGVWRAGGIVVQTSPLYTPRELERLYNDSGVETVVAMDLFWPNLAQAKPKIPVKRVVVCDIGDYLGVPVRQLYGLKKRKGLKEAGHWPLGIPDEPRVHRYKAVLATPAEPMTDVHTTADDVAVLQYTGGTTGTPKGAMLTHRNLIAGALQGGAWVGKRPRPERGVLAIPGFHIFGLGGALLGLFHGDEMIMEPNPRDFGHILKLIDENQATVFAGVPTMYTALLRHPKSKKYDLGSLQICYSGGAPLPGEIRHELEGRIEGRILDAYGLSECTPALTSPATGPAHEGIGFPHPDTDASIVDPDDPTKEMPVGEVGELALHGPQVMKGYWNQPEETALVLNNGWFLTGDLARMDSEGFFSIVERKKDMINASGYKVYPLEVEEVLFTHPAVLEAAVVGVPDAYRGETVKAFVVLRTGASAKEQDILAHCKEHLAPYKVPRFLEFVPDLPKSSIGKVLRRQLRDRERAKARPAM